MVSALLHATATSTVDDLVARVAPVLDSAACDAVRAQFQGVTPEAGGAIDELVPSGPRRRAGAYFTPPGIADQLARCAVDADETGRVADLSCGDGVLLAAVLRWAPGVDVVGVERELVFALAAAVRLVGTRARVIWGDGLAASPWLTECAAVLGNPPYVGEKGNRVAFDALRAEHLHLAAWFGPRIDLHYLFVHRGLDILRSGGRLAYLTSEYWLTATGAGLLRQDLGERTSETTFERLGAGAFVSAPGHHSLIFVARRAATTGVGSAATLHPFAAVERLATGTPLGELCGDRQGFVSGADRVTSKTAERYGYPRDHPIFLWRAAELPETDRDLFRPLLRGGDCVANQVVTEAPGHDFVLWCDGSEVGAVQRRIEARLDAFRALLEQRREAVAGTMSWTRIWWPRVTAEYARPKLVVPRRAKAPSFCLDLSGSFVSSDCTYLLAPDDVKDAAGYLMRVMIAANSARAAEQLRAFGKVKGEVMEFYATPLREWRLPLRRTADGVELTDPALAAEFRALAAQFVE